MVQNVFRTNRRGNWIFSAIYGALIALAFAYGISYLLTRFGIGVISDSAGASSSGPAVFARAALNLYAMHHITLVGSGQILSDIGGPQNVSAALTLPLTVWVFVPIAALIISGYIIARMRHGRRRWKTVVPAVLGGVLYAVILTAISQMISAKIGWFVIPEIGNVSPNPPQIPFHPHMQSTLAYTGAFGVLFTYLGAIFAVGSRQGESRLVRWWACGKAVIAMALTIQLLIAGAVIIWFFMNARTDSNDRTQSSRIAEMLPTASGMSYALINGANLVSGIEAYTADGELVSRPFYARVNIYKGIYRESPEKQQKPLPVYAYAIVFLTGIAIFMSGRIAVRLGSRDGSIPTALRITFFHTVYLAVLLVTCNIALDVTEGISKSLVYIKVQYTNAILLTVLFVFILSFIGAHFAKHSRSTL